MLIKLIRKKELWGGLEAAIISRRMETRNQAYRQINVTNPNMQMLMKKY